MTTPDSHPRTRREARERTAQAQHADMRAVGSKHGVDKKRKRRWPWIVGPIGGLLLIVVVVGGIFALQALSVKDKLEAAKSKLGQLVDDFKAADFDALQTHADEVLELTTSANSTVSNGLWSLASGVPFAGVNVEAVSETVKATHIIVRDGMPIAVDVMKSMNPDSLEVDEGGFDLSQLKGVEKKLPGLEAAFKEAKSHVDRIDRDRILPFVDANIEQVVDIVDQATPVIGVLEEYLPTILDLLGADGPRNYALMFQNNAEIRATGGNPGDGAVLHVENGKIEMRKDLATLAYIDRGHSGDTGNGPIEPWEASTLFESDTMGYSQNFTRFPDFRRAAEAASTLWNTATGESLDGVVAIDPVMLSYMLEVTGPIDMGEGEEKLTADNAVRVLLSDTYERFGNDGKAADEYFGRAASAIFSKVSGFDWDLLAMLDQVQRGVDEQRFYLWFPDAEKQALADEFGVTGVLTDSNDEVTQTGIYLNDTSHSKLEYWLSSEMTVTCNAAENTMTTTATLTNSIPDTIQSPYTTGQRSYRLGYDNRTILLEAMSFALPGGELVGTLPEWGDYVAYNEYGVGTREGFMNNRQGRSLFIAVAPGETKDVSFTTTIPSDALNSPLQVRYSPTTSETPVTIDRTCASIFPEPAEEPEN